MVRQDFKLESFFFFFFLPVQIPTFGIVVLRNDRSSLVFRGSNSQTRKIFHGPEQVWPTIFASLCYYDPTTSQEDTLHVK